MLIVMIFSNFRIISMQLCAIISIVWRYFYKMLKTKKKVQAAKMRRAAGRAPDPNGQGGGHMPKSVHGLTQTVQNQLDLVPKCVGQLEIPLITFAPSSLTYSIIYLSTYFDCMRYFGFVSNAHCKFVSTFSCKEHTN
jgi:hypothetical protein